MRKRKLLIINQSQFGYHLDTYYYCKYLKDDFDITYICMDYEKTKRVDKDISVKYISRSGSLYISYLRFLIEIINDIKSNKYNLIFLNYFRGCFLIKLVFPKSYFIFDIRTSSVHKSGTKRLIFNFILKSESMFFKKITIISESLREILNIPRYKSYILPLGADTISNGIKQFDKLSLLYIGTFNNRNIDQTVYGFEKFYREYYGKISICYNIIGYGHNNELENLKAIVKKKDLAHVINLPGYIHHEQVKKYFDHSNIGISYIPKTKFFDVQPSTKTFEYLLSGMPVIATSTFENKKVINDSNGVLIEDDSTSFYKGLVSIYNNLEKYDSKRIRNNSIKHQWRDIIENFKIYLMNI